VWPETQFQIHCISKSVSKADNKLHSISQGYMAYIEENNSLHALLLKIMPHSAIYAYSHPA
jgi:hypothetical protein